MPPLVAARHRHHRPRASGVPDRLIGPGLLARAGGRLYTVNLLCPRSGQVCLRWRPDRRVRLRRRNAPIRLAPSSARLAGSGTLKGVGTAGTVVPVSVTEPLTSAPASSGTLKSVGTSGSVVPVSVTEPVTSAPPPNPDNSLSRKIAVASPAFHSATP